MTSITVLYELPLVAAQSQAKVCDIMHEIVICNCQEVWKIIVVISVTLTHGEMSLILPKSQK